MTIKVVDVNDNAPFFEQKEYSGSVAETASVGAAVLSVSAQDADTEAADNVLQYELVENDDPGLQYFFMTSEADSSASHVGVLRVKKVSGALFHPLYASPPYMGDPGYMSDATQSLKMLPPLTSVYNIKWPRSR